MNICTVLTDYLLRLTLCFGVVRFFEKAGKQKSLLETKVLKTLAPFYIKKKVPDITKTTIEL